MQKLYIYILHLNKYVKHLFINTFRFEVQVKVAGMVVDISSDSKFNHYFSDHWYVHCK